MSEKSNAPEPGAKAHRLWDHAYQEHGQMIRSYIAAHLRSPHDVDDLVQDVFAAVVKRKHVPENLRHYLYATARNQLRLYWRKKKQRGRQVASLTPAYGDQILDMPFLTDPSKKLDSEEQRRIIMQAIDRLPTGLARVLHLRIVQGLSLIETAQMVGCSSEAVKKRLQRAKRSLLEHYEGMEDRRTHPAD